MHAPRSKAIEWLISFSVLLVGATTAWAQIEADPLPGDPKLVEFRYDPNNSFRVFTRPLASTHILLEADERIKQLALGDTSSWVWAHRDNNLFIKPKYPNISTPATLITNKRDYQFLFRSTAENGRWYQRVSFGDPSKLAIDANEEDRNELAAAAGEAKRSASTGGTGQLTRPEQLNFNYEVDGDASIKPVSIYDDGLTTYLVLRTDQDIPAVFRTVNGEIELVEFSVRSNAIVVPRVLEGGLLRLGNQEARFVNRAKSNGTALSGAKGFFRRMFQ